MTSFIDADEFRVCPHADVSIENFPERKLSNDGSSIIGCINGNLIGHFNLPASKTSAFVSVQ
jgi:hypothetical protein